MKPLQDRFLHCSINAAFRCRLERRIYGAGTHPPRDVSCNRSLLILLTGLALVPGCGHKPVERTEALPELPPMAVRVQSVESKPEPLTEEVVGTVRAKVRATLEAKISGQIERMPVFLGQTIKQDQLVARLDAAEIKARLQQAQANLQQAERDWKRISALFDQQAVTRSEFDSAEARHRVAQAAVAEARAMNSYINVLAPFDGVVTRKWAEAGDFAAPGKPLLELEDPTALQLEADVPEALASRIQRQAKLAIQTDSISNQLAGTVSELAPSADSTSRTFRVKLDLPSGSALMPGQFARLVVPVGESASLRVPAAAIVQRGQLELAFVATNQRAVLHLVKTGRRIGEEVEVLAGLDPGDSVIVEGASRVVDGQPVTVK
jgi:RND family efflux transporter MFP subunit